MPEAVNCPRAWRLSRMERSRLARMTRPYHKYMTSYGMFRMVQRTPWHAVEARRHAQKETAMAARPQLARPPILSQLLAALLACTLSGSLLGVVSGLFQREGAPFSRIVAAARDCRGYAFVSEREACIRIEAEAWLQRDFGVLDARWRSRDRQLKERLAGSDEWVELNCT